MLTLTWQKGGVRARLIGMRDTRTDCLRELTRADVEEFRRQFQFDPKAPVELLEEDA